MGSPFRHSTQSNEVELDLLNSNSTLSRVISSINRNYSAGSWWSSLFLVSSASLGVGILTLPYAIYVAGIYLGTIILILGMIVTSFSCDILIECSHHCRGSPYFYILGNYLYRKTKIRLGTISESLLVIECYMSIVVYILILSDLPVYALYVAGVTNQVLLSKYLWCGVTVGIIYPLSLFTEISALRYTSLISILSAAGIAIGLMIMCLFKEDFGNRITHAFIYNPFQELKFELLDIFPLVIFSFTCQVVILSIYDQLEEKSIRSGQQFVSYGLSLILIIYLITGICGYIAFINEDFSYQILSSGFENYPCLLVSVTSIQLCIAACLMIVFRVHLSIYPCRDGIHTIFGNSMHDISKLECVVISTIIIPSAAALALFLPEIEYLIIGLGSILNPIVRSKVGIFLHSVFILLSEVQDPRV
jgi:amino acid permease